MARASTFPLVDRIVGGDLVERLRSWRAEGLSGVAIRDRLRDDFEIEVDPATVNRWLTRYCEAEPAA